MKESIYRWIALKIPRKLRYFILIDSWAKATTGKYSKEIVSELSVVDMIKRFE